MHTDLGSDEWKGYALFIVYQVHEPHTYPKKRRKLKVNENGNLNSTTLDSGNPNFPYFVCQFQANEVDIGKPLVLCDLGAPCVGPNGFWVYIPTEWFRRRARNSLGGWGNLEASITTGSLNVEVKVCGARVVLEQSDASELYQVLNSICPHELGWAMGGIWPTERGVLQKKLPSTKSSLSMALTAPKTCICHSLRLHELMDEVGACIVSFDRAGYGDSDPNPKRLVRSEAFDIQELADQLKLGPRLTGVTLVVINFWWPSFPPKLMNEVYKKQLKRDQWKLWIGHYAPRLVYWWMTQKWFPYCSILQRHPILFNKRDVETIQKMSQVPIPDEIKLPLYLFSDGLCP
ncbi:hypothetical protein FH972_006090 [Carpinus fangiana]|uniref:Uncharacterized protein n=1 Tax=Carpinus fangiana TaxID=176857 RepID=A0A5N6QS73_9ROSI|nr:hypothetical protein FH972_006090 [Carpinus fangiana]